MEMSPALILATYDRTEKERAEQALMLLETVRAATAVSWVAKGSELFQKTFERFQRLAGFTTEKKTDDVKANRKKLAGMFQKMGLFRN